MLFTLALLLTSFAHAGAPPTALPIVVAEPGSATVSGISAGAFMAVQVQVALSSRIHGAASIAGGIYGCAEGSLLRATIQCLKYPGVIDPESYVRVAQDEERRGDIDRLTNLASARFYLLHSRDDETVGFSALSKLRQFVEHFTPVDRVKVVELNGAAHGFPTNGYGVPCADGGSPYLINCGRDAAGELLAQLYGPLNPPSTSPQGTLVSFDQSAYADTYEAGLSQEGYAYIPNACRHASCRVHFALHGCQMGSEFIKDAFRLHAGYNRWADTNHIVVIYPDAAKSFSNPQGCWDWWGTTGSDYATKKGPQIRFIAKILDAFGL